MAVQPTINAQAALSPARAAAFPSAGGKSARPGGAASLVTLTRPSSLADRIGKLTVLLDKASDGIGALKAAGEALGALRQLIDTAEMKAQGALAQSPASTARLVSTRGAPLPSRATLTNLGFEGGDSLVFRDGSKTISFEGTASVQAVVDGINASGSELRASLENGQLAVENVYGGYAAVELTGHSGDDGLELLFGGAVEAGAKSASAFSTWNQTRFDLGEEFTALQDDIEAAIETAQHKGVNLLKGDGLSLAFGDGAPALDIGEVTLDAASLGVTGSATQHRWQSDGEIDASLARIAAAKEQLSELTGTVERALAAAGRREDLGSAVVATLRSGLGEDVAIADEDEAAGLAAQLGTQLAGSDGWLTMAGDRNALRSF
jgi:hypothetical protein